MHILLAGNPNCGKTTLFNALTGDNQRVGNWSGVTVEKKSKTFTFNQQKIEITDLPGIYSLTVSSAASHDEQIAAGAIVSLPVDVIINVIDACHLERHLYLTSQLLELGKPIIIVLNMMDIAAQRGIHVDPTVLSSLLKCPVVALQAHKKIGLDLLRQAINVPVAAALPLSLPLAAEISSLLNSVQHHLTESYNVQDKLARYYALRMLEGDKVLLEKFAAKSNSLTMQDYDIELADARYQQIHHIVAQVQKKHNDAREYYTAKIDKILLHRYLAVPIFFSVMYLMFFFAMKVGGALQDFFDIAGNAVFVKGSASLLTSLHMPNWVIALVANGLGMGINTALTFIPVLAAMFFFLSFLEASGYMARAAFVVDKAMRLFGLPGKSFVPMIVGFGCNVPAVMAARTLDNERDRYLTVLMAPFMSCSARLAIYAVFVAAFFPAGGQNIVFSLYLIGILMAMFTGFILRKTTLKGTASPLILELPAYHKPALKRLLQETSRRLKYFIIRAGRMIIPVCMVIGVLNSLTISGNISANEASPHSLLSIMGYNLTPLFAPMGLHGDNWPATVGLLTGMLAKEVVVGSLNVLYAAPNVYGEMVKHFDGQAGAFAYLLFILLYIPCISTMAAIRQETSSKLMWFSITWSLLIAYAASVIFYQTATFFQHPQQSIGWITAMLSCIGLFIGFMKYRSTMTGEVKYAAANS